jgi:hypothetical protein
VASRNGWKGGTRPMLRALADALRREVNIEERQGLKGSARAGG